MFRLLMLINFFLPWVIGKIISAENVEEAFRKFRNVNYERPFVESVE